MWVQFSEHKLIMCILIKLQGHGVTDFASPPYTHIPAGMKSVNKNKKVLALYFGVQIG